MIWLVWRQHRGEALIAGLVLATLAVVLVLSGREIASAYQQLGVGACVGPSPANPNCNDIIRAFENTNGGLEFSLLWLNVLPAVLAILVGAPLVARELENRTHHLVWTQSATRLRWLAVKLALVLGAAVLAWLMLTLLTTWWRGPFDAVSGNLPIEAFDFEGTVPLAYVAFALALAVAAGTVIRKTIPAMLVTLGGYLAVRLPVDFWLRPRYLPPLTATVGANDLTPYAVAHGWVIDAGWVDRLGHPVSDNTIFNTLCNSNTLPGKSAVFQCIQSHGLMQRFIYQPADRFWTFQGIETGIYVGLAFILVALTIWWVRRRIA